ncbi:Transcription factor, K-box [Cynara cardunculus var. scolymus]|uniref:Transcription factor, K-box n=1 Tax=Cynara cardunculus var. scolymus TaxID=59895 RepID=A0A124S2A9_CYNCS|nr:Transcription factor, K-box [Cynara cardunculus var. scolymus]
MPTLESRTLKDQNSGLNVHHAGCQQATRPSEKPSKRLGGLDAGWAAWHPRSFLFALLPLFDLLLDVPCNLLYMNWTPLVSLPYGLIIKSTIERYKKATSSTPNTWSSQEINAQFYQQESKKLRQQIQMLQNTNRHLMGEGLGCLNVKELKQLETRLERGISRIRSKKEIELEHHNAFLRSKVQIAESERVQQLNVNTGHEYNALQAYLARNALQLNIMEPMEDAPSAYSIPQKHSLHLG